MKYRKFGRIGWQVSEIGYGMWGLAGWTGSDDKETERALQRSVELGCNFFDTAWAYGKGKSEQILGELVRQNRSTRLYTATKIPPKNFAWPARPNFTLEDCYPPEHIEEYVNRSLKNSGLEQFDLVQFHTWDDSWSNNESWQEICSRLREQGKFSALGISLNRWEPTNGIKALRTNQIDAVQVIYNIFDQNPEDQLFPVCKELDIAVIARVPFDEGTLTGTLTRESTWPKEDWRSTYFVPENLIPSVERADKLKPLVEAGSSMADMALRFILGHESVNTIIPGMRKTAHVEANLAASDNGKLPEALQQELKKHRWDRSPTKWSQ